MFKFMRGRAGGAGHHLSADRIKDLFSLSKATRHGFPHNPTALAHDPSLDLIAIATRKSEIRVYGRPGVEYTGELDPESVVKEMHFIPDKRGQLVLLMDDGVIQLWQLATEASSDGQFRVEKVKSVEDFRRGHEQDVRVAVTLMVTESKEEILVGTTGGNIHSISLSSFSLTEGPDAVLYQEAVLHSASPNNKITTQGSVEVLAQRPGHADSFLIGYQRGVLVLWNASTRSAERVYHSGQVRLSLSSEFLSVCLCMSCCYLCPGCERILSFTACLFVLLSLLVNQWGTQTRLLMLIPGSDSCSR